MTNQEAGAVLPIEKHLKAIMSDWETGKVRYGTKTIEDLVVLIRASKGLIEESLYHLRLDDRAKDYHHRALALLAKLEGDA